MPIAEASTIVALMTAWRVPATAPACVESLRHRLSGALRYTRGSPSPETQKSETALT
jgi:hypothetical protein